MNNFGIFDSLQTLTNITKPFINTKQKERVDTILEPLQGIVQLALLSKCPIKTKLAIKQNNLYIQLPLLHQGMIRWYNNDRKGDLVYIFNIIKRFQLFYKKIFQTRPELYKLLIQLASHGLIQLQKTYDAGLNVTLVQTLKIYNSILLGNINFSLLENNNINMDQLNVCKNRQSVLNDTNEQTEINDSDNESFYSACSVDNNTQQIQTDNIILETNSIISSSTNQRNVSISFIQDSNISIDIESVFFNITKIYPNELYDILYNLFALLYRDEIKYNNCLQIVESLFKPFNKKIHYWINKHLIF